MKRCIIRALAFLSLLGMAGSVALWVRSYHVADWIEFCQLNLTVITAHGKTSILGHQGRFAVFTDEPFFLYTRRDISVRYAEPPEGSVAKVHLLGLKYYEFPPPLGVSWMLVVPLRLPVILCSAGFAYGCWRWYRRKGERVEQRLCARCAYDLRSHKPGDKCPECGTPIPWTDESTKPPTTN